MDLPLQSPSHRDDPRARRNQEQPLTVAVAGATGFVGGGIAAELAGAVTRHRSVASGTRRGAGWRTTWNCVGRRLDRRRTARCAARRRRIGHRIGIPESAHRGAQARLDLRRVDAAGTERLVDAAVAADVRHLVYISGAGAARRRAALVSCQVARRDGRPIERYPLHHRPADLGLRPARRLAQPLPGICSPTAGRAAAQHGPATAGSGVHRRCGAPCGRLAPGSIKRSTRPSRSVGQTQCGCAKSLPARCASRLEQAHRARANAAHQAWRRAPLVAPKPPITPDAIDFINQPATADLAPLLSLMPRRLTPLGEGLRTYLGPSAEKGDVRISSDRSEPLRPVASHCVRLSRPP